MKKVYFILASICVAALAFSCQKGLEEAMPLEEETGHLTTITCEFPTMTDQNGTKVSLAADGTTGWQAGDKIVIYGQRCTDPEKDPTGTAIDPVYHTLTAGEIVDSHKAVFSVDLSSIPADPDGAHPYNAAYPADSWSYYSDWYSSARARFDETNQLLLAGYVDGGVMTMLNLTAAIVFKVTGDFDTYYFSGAKGNEVVGYEKYLVQVNKSTPKYIDKVGSSPYGTIGDKTEISGPVVGDGSTLNYIFIPNEVALVNGFTITFAKNGVKTGIVTAQNGVSLTHGQLLNLGEIPSGAIKAYSPIPDKEKATAVELSDPKSANSYIVSAVGTTNDNKVFKFPAVKGNTYVKGSDAGTSVGTVANVEVLWESWNNSTTPTAKSIIKVVDFKDGFVYFKTPESLHEGNALIAAKDAENNILWSWHIWAPNTAIEEGKFGIASSNIMDRNLGALVKAGTGDVTAVGMLYQWGRKDPFLGVGAYGSSSIAKCAGVTKTTYTTDASAKMTLEESIKNPTVFSNFKGNWITPADNTLWQPSTKTIYDPCPPGWRVPGKHDIEGIFYIENASDYTYDAENYCLTVGSAIFPLTGLLYYSNGNIDGRDVKARVWSSNYGSDDLSRWFSVDNASTFNTWDERKVYGCSVRCVAEPTE